MGPENQTFCGCHNQKPQALIFAPSGCNESCKSSVLLTSLNCSKTKLLETENEYRLGRQAAVAMAGPWPIYGIVVLLVLMLAFVPHTPTQGSPNPLTKEYTLNGIGIPNMCAGIFLNQAILGSLATADAPPNSTDKSFGASSGLHVLLMFCLWTLSNVY